MADITVSEAAAAGGNPDNTAATNADRIFYPGINTCLTITFLMYRNSLGTRYFLCADNTVGNMIGGHVSMFFNDGINAAGAALDIVNNRLIPSVAAQPRMIKSVLFAGMLGLQADYNILALKNRINGRFWSCPSFKVIDLTNYGTAYAVVSGPDQRFYVRSGEGYTVNQVINHPTQNWSFEEIPEEWP